MPIYRCLLNGGGRCVGGTTLADARNTLNSKLYVIAGDVSEPVRVRHKTEGGKIYECYQLGEAKGIIISGYKGNPAPDFLD
ncbi:hypothetical protein NVP1215B_003 [Vibrio phage 1.215.B._10N.222.54.F7]|nr:hypothetical protein NVP1215A_003 [Vibrio phage 1.215.A._10N.222.54.F7]AUR96026.1 hypothetical protein NVP1215B_003 [Vibrio phage 1.215.B._10N.222.54.F7]